MSRVRAGIRTVQLAVLLLASANLAASAELAVVRHFRSVDGLPVSSASAAAVDADGFLWLATHDGLARFDGRECTRSWTDSFGMNRFGP